MLATFYDIQPQAVHPEIMKYLSEQNTQGFVDPKTDSRLELGSNSIKDAFDIPEAKIYYFPNGSSANVTALSAMLLPFEGAISVQQAHINRAETGALEASGHKILSVKSKDGKLNVDSIEKIHLAAHGAHMVVPRAIYLTNLSEEGTLYTKTELKEIIDYAKANKLYTYLDGARLAPALQDSDSDMSLRQFGNLGLDMFTVGGTKNGGMYGEALVNCNPDFHTDFERYIKRQCGHMNKPLFMSLQYARFFKEDSLWLKLAEYSNKMADILRKELAVNGFGVKGRGNHAFIQLDKIRTEKLKKNLLFLFID